MNIFKKVLFNKILNICFYLLLYFMANFSIIKYLPKCTTVKKKDFRTEQLELLVLLRNHSTMKKTPKFAQVQGNFINKNNKYKEEKRILLSHLNDHVCSLKSLCKRHYSLCTELKQLTGKFLYLVIINHINTLQFKE